MPASVQKSCALLAEGAATRIMSTSEIFLIAMGIIFLVPYVIWRVGRTEYYAPLVVVQILTGILLGPGVLGAVFPTYYSFVFNPAVIQALNGIAWWAVMSFVWIAGIELDLTGVWRHRRESGITAGLALGTPLLFGSAAALIFTYFDGWIGPRAATWQFVAGLGMACAVTALPILILFMEKLEILRQPIGQRILRYASLDDIAIWGVLALILMDWHRIGKQIAFLLIFALAGWCIRRLMARIPERDRWYVGLIWLALCGLGADWSGLHFMVGAFLSGALLDSKWFNQKQMDALRHHVGVFPQHGSSHELERRWTGSVSWCRVTAHRCGGWQAARYADRRQDTSMGAGRKYSDRVAAADQGTHHDHFCQYPARQRDHHQRHLHRALADGSSQHHDLCAARDTKTQQAALRYIQVRLIQRGIFAQPSPPGICEACVRDPPLK